MLPVHVVWYKRDLRVSDHHPLTNAAHVGAVLPLYIIEPSVIHADDYSRRHYAFTRDCLCALRENLTELGQPLVVRVGEAVDIFAAVHEQVGIAAIHAHEETGNAITYARDIALHEWTQQQGIPFYETPNNGVIRPLRDRDKRQQQWQALMRGDPLPRPPRLRPVPAAIDIGTIPTWDALGIRDEGIDDELRQRGGERAGRRVLYDFLYRRGADYPRQMSSPVTAAHSCSRISPYLTYGTLSLRQVFYALEKRRTRLDAAPNKYWSRALNAFESRLHWHDHFIQKLEDEPRIEHESFVPAYDTLRDDPTTNAQAALRFAAYRAGCTGYPMVDASMRCLRATGWINFRMRAMLVSFASYDLWLRWQVTARFLARLFTDYEPGIHYSQVQMQSGATGINALRVYNPTKQGQDHDPDGTFIRHWLPELAHVPDVHIHEPHLMPPLTQREASCIIGDDYPAPIVAHKAAANAAKDAVWSLRQMPDVQAVAERVVQRHGSRRTRNRR